MPHPWSCSPKLHPAAPLIPASTALAISPTPPLSPRQHPSHPDTPIALPALPVLFAEEPGLVLEVQEADLAQVLKRYRDAGLCCLELGRTGDAGPHAMVRM